MMGASTRAAVTSMAAAAVAGAGYVSGDALALVTAGLGVTFALGWPRLLDLPAERGAVVVLAGTALVVPAVVRLSGVHLLAAVLGLVVVAAFVHEMLRRDGRPRLVESVSGVVTGAVVLVSAGGWAVAGAGRVTDALVVTGAATITAAAAATAVPVRLQAVATLATVVGGLAGLITGAVLSAVGAVPGLLVGLAAGILTASLHVLFGRFPASRRVRPALAAALLPLLVLGGPVYLVGRILTG